MSLSSWHVRCTSCWRKSIQNVRESMRPEWSSTVSLQPPYTRCVFHEWNNLFFELIESIFLAHSEEGERCSVFPYCTYCCIQCPRILDWTSIGKISENILNLFSLKQAVFVIPVALSHDVLNAIDLKSEEVSDSQERYFHILSYPMKKVCDLIYSEKNNSSIRVSLLIATRYMTWMMKFIV